MERKGMKESRYNYFKQYGTTCLMVNGRTGAALLLDMQKYAEAQHWVIHQHLLNGTVEAPESEANAGRANIDPDLLRLLETFGFVVPNEMDEWGELQAVEVRHLASQRVLNLHVNPTLDCNMNCWYCYEKHKEGSGMDVQTQERLLSFVRKQIRSGQVQGVHISYFGGEPFLRYHDVILPLNRKLEELCAFYKVEVSYSATTNGSLLSDFYSHLLTEAQDGTLRWKALQITLDGQETHHNRVRKYKADGGVTYHQIMTNLLRVLSTGRVDVHLRVNYSNANLEGLFELLLDIPEHLRSRLAIALHRIWQTQDEETVLGSEEIYERLNRAGFRMQSQSLMLGKQEVCYADRQAQWLVNYDGNLFKCTARDFTPESRLGYLDKHGEIVYEKDRWEKRREVKQSQRPACKTCNLFPLCKGPCSQLLYEGSPEDLPCVLDNRQAELNVFMDQVLERMRLKYAGQHRSSGLQGSSGQLGSGALQGNGGLQGNGALQGSSGLEQRN